MMNKKQIIKFIGLFIIIIGFTMACTLNDNKSTTDNIEQGIVSLSEPGPDGELMDTKAINCGIKDGMLVFQNNKDFINALHILTNAPRKEVDAWEKNIGFTSQRSIFQQIVADELALDEQYEGMTDSELSQMQPPESHSSSYYYYLDKDIIKLFDEGTEDESYNYSICDPSLAKIVNEDGMMAVSGVIYQYTSNRIKRINDNDFSKISLLKKVNESSPVDNITVEMYPEANVSRGVSNRTVSSGWKTSGKKKRYRLSLYFTSDQYLANGTMWKVTYNINFQCQEKNFWGNWKYKSAPKTWISGDWLAYFELEHPVNLHLFNASTYGDDYASDYINNFWSSVNINGGGTSPYPSTFYYQYNYGGEYIRIINIRLGTYYWHARNAWGDAIIGNSSIGYVTPVGFTWCARENTSYSFDRKVDVAYGANGKWVYKYNVSGTINFNNSTFGDPIPGVFKGGFYRVR
jgi:hypothetical protein